MGSRSKLKPKKMKFLEEYAKTGDHAKSYLVAGYKDKTKESKKRVYRRCAADPLAFYFFSSLYPKSQRSLKSGSPGIFHFRTSPWASLPFMMFS